MPVIPFIIPSFRVVLVTPLNSNTLRVFLSMEPRHQSVLSPSDVLNRLSWTIVVVSGPGELPALEEAENALAQPSAIPSIPGAWSVDLRLDRRLLLSTVYQVTASNLLVSASGITIAPSSSGSCPGIAVLLPLPLQRTSRTAIGIDFFYDTFQARWRLDGRNDIDVHGGDDARRKRVIRRLVTRRGAFRHLPGYGLGLAVKDPFTTTDIARLRADAKAQILQEEDIEDVRIDVTTIPGGIIMKVTAKPTTGGAINLTFEVPTRGPIVVS